MGVGVRAAMAGFDGSVDYNMATKPTRVANGEDEKYSAIAAHLQYAIGNITPVAEVGIGNITIGANKVDYTELGLRVEYTQEDWAGMKYYAGFSQKAKKIKDGNETTETNMMVGVLFYPSVKLSTPPPAPAAE